MCFVSLREEGDAAREKFPTQLSRNLKLRTIRMKVKNAVAKIQNKSRSDGNMTHNLLKKELDLLENIVGVDKPILKSIVINVDLKKLKMITVNIVVLVEECVYS